MENLLIRDPVTQNKVLMSKCNWAQWMDTFNNSWDWGRISRVKNVGKMILGLSFFVLFGIRFFSLIFQGCWEFFCIDIVSASRAQNVQLSHYLSPTKSGQSDTFILHSRLQISNITLKDTSDRFLLRYQGLWALGLGF